MDWLEAEVRKGIVGKEVCPLVVLKDHYNMLLCIMQNIDSGKVWLNLMSGTFIKL